MRQAAAFTDLTPSFDYPVFETGDLSFSDEEAVRLRWMGRRERPMRTRLDLSRRPEFRSAPAALPESRHGEPLDWRIVFGALALSLLVAQSSFAEMRGQATEVQPQVKVSQFAQAEINRYEEVIAAVTERAENEENPLRIKRYTAQLKKLSRELDQAKKAQAQWKRQSHLESEPFARENLKESIQSLQESGSQLLDDMIAADRQAEIEAGSAQASTQIKSDPTPMPRTPRAVEGRALGQQ